MYALIYDDPDQKGTLKKVISVHESRNDAEQALYRRREDLHRPILECHTRIVWVDRAVSAGEKLSAKDFADWKKGEKIPVGELYSDED
ncbi:MAG: hypothetical protein K9K63_12850 [Desulfotignum sp.]|nr:hypothetical protein [Desulfotignum sp.]MCF8089217.1 hypothetical protein [Desulfotignum sp.]MCF8138188.1 hypothetical protein [Desulfotignum sp.]